MTWISLQHKTLPQKNACSYRINNLVKEYATRNFDDQQISDCEDETSATKIEFPTDIF
jgi:hypothetical protein